MPQKMDLKLIRLGLSLLHNLSILQSGSFGLTPNKGVNNLLSGLMRVILYTEHSGKTTVPRL